MTILNAEINLRVLVSALILKKNGRKRIEMKKVEQLNLEKFIFYIQNNLSDNICANLSLISRNGFRDYESVKEYIPFVKELLNHKNDAILEKVLWTLGQVGFRAPFLVNDCIEKIEHLLKHPETKVRCNAVWSLGRIGRNDVEVAKKEVKNIMELAIDEMPEVRMNVIWAAENIAVNSPELFTDYFSVFLKLLDDTNTQYVRREAPEIFRVLGKRKIYIVDSIPKLEKMAESDEDRVVRIHSAGALKLQKNYLLAKEQN